MYIYMVCLIFAVIVCIVVDSRILGGFVVLAAALVYTINRYRKKDRVYTGGNITIGGYVTETTKLGTWYAKTSANRTIAYSIAKKLTNTNNFKISRMDIKRIPCKDYPGLYYYITGSVYEPKKKKKKKVKPPKTPIDNSVVQSDTSPDQTEGPIDTQYMYIPSNVLETIPDSNTLQSETIFESTYVRRDIVDEQTCITLCIATNTRTTFIIRAINTTINNDIDPNLPMVYVYIPEWDVYIRTNPGENRMTNSPNAAMLIADKPAIHIPVSLFPSNNPQQADNVETMNNMANMANMIPHISRSDNELIGKIQKTILRKNTRTYDDIPDISKRIYPESFSTNSGDIAIINKFVLMFINKQIADITSIIKDAIVHYSRQSNENLSVVKVATAAILPRQGYSIVCSNKYINTNTESKDVYYICSTLTQEYTIKLPAITISPRCESLIDPLRQYHPLSDRYKEILSDIPKFLWDTFNTTYTITYLNKNVQNVQNVSIQRESDKYSLTWYEYVHNPTEPTLTMHKYKKLPFDKVPRNITHRYQYLLLPQYNSVYTEVAQFVANGTTPPVMPVAQYISISNMSPMTESDEVSISADNAGKMLPDEYLDYTNILKQSNTNETPVDSLMCLLDRTITVGEYLDQADITKNYTRGYMQPEYVKKYPPQVQFIKNTGKYIAPPGTGACNGKYTSSTGSGIYNLIGDKLYIYDPVTKDPSTGEQEICKPRTVVINQQEYATKAGPADIYAIIQNYITQHNTSTVYDEIIKLNNDVKLDKVAIVVGKTYPTDIPIVLYMPSKLNGAGIYTQNGQSITHICQSHTDPGVLQFIVDNADRDKMLNQHPTNGINSVRELLYRPYPYTKTDLVLSGGLLCIDAIPLDRIANVCTQFSKDLNIMKLLIISGVRMSSGGGPSLSAGTHVADVAYASPRPYNLTDGKLPPGMNDYARTLTILVVYSQVQLLIQYAKMNSKRVIIPMIPNPIYGDNGMDMLFAILLAIADYQKRNPAANDVYPFITMLCQNDTDYNMYNTTLSDLRSQLNPPNIQGSGRVPKCLWVSTLDIQ